MGKGPPTERARIIDCRQDAVRAVRYNVDGNYCLTCGSDKSIKLWNPIKGSLLKTYTGTGNEVFDAASSSDNSQVAAGGADKCLTVFDVETGKILRRWRAHAARVNTVAFNEESNVFNEATDSVLSIDINGGEIVAGSADCNYRLYSIREGNVHIDFMGNSVNCVHFTPDGNCVLASTQDGNLRLMDKVNGKMLASYSGHKNSEYKVDSCVLASIEEVATGSEDGFVYIYSLLDSNVVGKLEHPSKVVHSLSPHPKKQHLLTAAGQLVYLWVAKNDEDFEC
ncbi:WD domain, G-beta repeat protein [Necator americanus]|uniref:WD repeat domain-containing protein 83 n=1 Tax=Necator americanus TaxID=51031 RepID=W2SP62_NECAM|nr:WD domain, G-beta repeat protein [Necator americanus]ETN71288.1 WD domain, G-beta repeat protein [Necator americanus]